MEKIQNYHETLLKTAFNLLSAGDYISQIPQKELFATFIPKGATKWRSMFKSLGYFALGKTENLVLIHKSNSKNSNKISVLDGFDQVYMGKKRKKSTKIKNLIKKFKIVNFVEKEFKWISAELPLLRIIGDYQTLTFIEVSEFVDLEELAILFQSIKDCAKFVFISDFASQKEMEFFADMEILEPSGTDIKKYENAFMTLFFIATAENFGHNAEILLHDFGPKENKSGLACMVF